MQAIRAAVFYKTSAALILLYGLCLILLKAIEHFYLGVNIFSANNFLYWDAAHYSDIRTSGYVNENVAFFPLFPFLWKCLPDGLGFVVAFNGILFLLSMALLAREFNFQHKNL